jgi:hypothetical protein
MAADYLEARPGFPQRIKGKDYVIKWIYSTKSDAEKKVESVKESKTFSDVTLYARKKKGKLYGKHPWCVAVR